MFVKRLKMAGFKSFANPTLLEFEPAVNVIVGPNGSGKSNISDAISWVLGSQAPTSLRSGSMEDVIFAGSEARSRLAVAEVELTLDNADGELRLDLSEITIHRSTDREGASEYRINGAPCRLLDVMELLSDTGVGRSIHSVVGQGQLDQILNARAEDRRSLIEEAAQIGKFRRRKDRALRKLERVEDNLVRLEDILAELRRAIRPVKRQANAAAVYSEVVAEHRDLRQRLAATEVQRLEVEESGLDIESAEQRAELLTDELESIRARLESATAEREELSRGAESRQQLAHRIGRAADRLGSLGRVAEERAGRISARLAAETEETYRERIHLNEQERERWSAESAAIEKTSRSLRSRAGAATESAERARAAELEAERTLHERRTVETEAAQSLVRAEGREAASAATLGSIEARVEAVMENREMRRRGISEDERAVAAAEGEVSDLERDLDRITELAAQAEIKLEAERERFDRLDRALHASQSERAAAGARVAALVEAVEAVSDIDGASSRLEPLLAKARERAEVAGADESDAARILATARGRVEAAWQVVARHDEEIRRLDTLINAASERLAGKRRRREQREIEIAALDQELSRVRQELAQAQSVATEERATIPAKRAAAEEARAEREEAERRLGAVRSEAEEAARNASGAAAESRTVDEQVRATVERLRHAEERISNAQSALEGLTELRADLQLQRDRAETVAVTARRSARHALGWASDAEARAERARERAHAAEHHLGELRKRERELETQLTEASQLKSVAEIKRAQMQARTEAIVERSLEEWGLGLDGLQDIEVLDSDGEKAALARVNKLERELRRLGPVNPRAGEEYKEMADREEFLVGQMEDLNASKRDLMSIVTDVDNTIVEVFSGAFDDVAREFETVFSRLFPGGTGNLRLTDPNDLLNSGIEVEARPPGKNVRKLSLLSGGERSLVALAFLFAIFRSRPSPFYLLDEVEAALDDVNLLRFLGLVEELEKRAQVLIVTHQKRTMEAADVLYGVTMKEGVSSVVAKRMDETQALVS